MGNVTIWQNGASERVSFSGTPVLQRVLTQAGFPVDNPCGGRGVCGKCAVKLSGRVSEPNEAERKAGTRLSCQAVLLGDAEVWLEDTRANRIEVSGGETKLGKPMAEGIGAAVDIGTTTVVIELFDLQTGKALATSARMNPQRSVAADVMGRIGAAMKGQGELLKSQIQEALSHMLEEACRDAGIAVTDVQGMVLAGNTTMLYLLTGRDPECLSHAPFEADTLFGGEDQLLGIRVYYPPCMNACVGADITCAVLASGMYENTQTALLCDIGTNGEIALWKDGRLYVTSTAAGPAFEGAGISCGCGSVNGAIDRVWTENGEIRAHTIGDAPAVGICGSGLIDAIAAFLETGQIDETGACEDDSLPLRDGIGADAGKINQQLAQCDNIQHMKSSFHGNIQGNRRFLSENPDAPGGFVHPTRGQEHQIAFAGQFFDHVLPGRQGRPWLNAHIGGAGFRPVPDAQIGHIRVGNRDAFAGHPGAKGHAPGHVLQDHRVVVKQSVPQRQIPVVFQKIPLIIAAQVNLGREAHPVGLAGLGEFQHIILKVLPFFQRNPEAGVPANAEGHGVLALIVYRVLNFYPVFHQPVRDLQPERKRILGQRGLRAPQLQYQPVLRLGCGLELILLSDKTIWFCQIDTA